MSVQQIGLPLLRIFTFLLVWLVLLAVAFAGGYFAYHQAKIEMMQELTAPKASPFRPRPRPTPEPPPAPLEESDARLFQRLRLHIEQAADERASKKIEAAFDEAIRKMDQFNPEPPFAPVSDEPSQFVFTSLFASAIMAMIWKVVKLILMAIIGSVIIGLIYTYSVWLSGAFVIGVTIICWPIAFAAAKLAQPSKEKA